MLSHTRSESKCSARAFLRFVVSDGTAEPAAGTVASAVGATVSADESVVSVDGSVVSFERNCRFSGRNWLSPLFQLSHVMP